MQPTSPDPQFDFMLKNNPPPKRGLGLPNIPKPAKIILGVVLGLLLIIIISSAISGSKKGSTVPIINSLARSQEILRVTQLAQQRGLRDPSTQAEAATVTSALTSEQQQLITYLAGNGNKVGKAQLAADTDKSTDSTLQTASQANGLDAAYVNYLRVNLSKYGTDLQTAYNAAGPKGKGILGSAMSSTSTLLNTPPIK